MSNVFTRRREKLLALKSLRSGGPRSAPAPACPACGAEVPRGELHKNLYVCPRCGHHHAVSAYYRLSLVLDDNRYFIAVLKSLDRIRYSIGGFL